MYDLSWEYYTERILSERNLIENSPSKEHVYLKEKTADRSLQALCEEENYKGWHLEYSSVGSPIVELQERGRAEAGELWDVALEKGLKQYLVWHFALKVAILVFNTQRQ